VGSKFSGLFSGISFFFDLSNALCSKDLRESGKKFQEKITFLT